jgi:pilus assembly protein Flp/PilA
MLNPFITLTTLVAFAQDRLKQEKGATAVEYGLMVGLIAVVIIAAVTLLGTELKELFETISGKLGGAGAAAPAAG